MKFLQRIRFHFILGLTLAFAGQLLGQSSSANSTVFMAMTGGDQGRIDGEVTQVGREKQHRLLAYSHEIVSPRDPASGQATGKRQHQPFRIVKLINKGSPHLLTAMKNNEVLTQVVVDIWAPSVTGREEKLLTYTLKNARIVSLRPWMPNKSDASAQPYPPAEEIAFVYQTIKLTFHNGGIESEDDWNGTAQQSGTRTVHVTSSSRIPARHHEGHPRPTAAPAQLHRVSHRLRFTARSRDPLRRHAAD